MQLQIAQPTRAALEWLGEQDHRLSYVEISLDLELTTQEECERAFREIWRGFVKPNHRDQSLYLPPANSELGTFYTGPRRAPNVTAIYADRPSKVTGKPCVHFDHRIKGAPALRRAKINSVYDLLYLDVRTFWRRRLRLFKFDLEHLGRLYHNSVRRSRRQKSWITNSKHNRFKYNNDRRAGGMLLHLHCGSVQAVIDAHRHNFNVNRALRPYDADHLLPDKLSDCDAVISKG
jgi:hypothetical protein